MAAKPSDKYIPLYFVAFFAVVFAVNAVFLYFATQTHTGVVTKNSYEKGLDYNETIKLAESQEDIGGKIELINNELIFSSDKKISANVIAYISRPTQDGYDYQIELVNNERKYFAKPNFPLKGQWKVTILAKWEDKQYQQSKIVIAR